MKKDKSSVETQFMLSFIGLAAFFGLKSIHHLAIIQNK